MKKVMIILIAILVVSCSTTIPLQVNLNDQTMLMAPNKNIKVEAKIKSEVPDGFIKYTSVQKNGVERPYNQSYMYNASTAHSKIWKSYMSSKFNSYSDDVIEITIILKELMLRDKVSTSIGLSMMTGNIQNATECIIVIEAIINYKGENFHKSIEVSTSDFNESQTSSYGGISYVRNQKNPTQQKAQLIDNCFNKSIVHFENYLTSVLQTMDKY